MNPGLVLLATVAVLVLGLAAGDAHAISPNQSLVLEGAGYLATERTIKTSDLNIVLETGAQSGSRTSIDIEGGLVTITNNDYTITGSQASSLREGKYIRISATAESADGGDEITISALGRLIQNSKSGSIYTFTGRIIDGDTTYKIIYIGQLSNAPTPATTEGPAGEITVHILKGASNPALTSSYIGRDTYQKGGYFSVDSLTITPDTSVTFVNDDVVPHTLVSGTGLAATVRINSGGFMLCESQDEAQSGSSYVGDNCDFTFDGRLDSGEIAPGESWTATFEEMGFYRLIDPAYPWMNLVSYTFPESDTLILRQDSNRPGN